MYPNDINDRGCPLRNQNGAVAVQHFDTLLASLTPEMRAAFEQERAARQAELNAYVTEHGYHS